MSDDNTQEIATEVVEAFNAAVAAEKLEEEVKMDMIGAGASFRSVNRLYNRLAEEAGLIVSKKDKQTAVNDVCSEAEGLDTEEGFTAAISNIMERVPGITEKSAAASIRRYAKDHELGPVWKAAKKVASGKGRGDNSLRAVLGQLMIDNYPMSDEDVTNYLKENASENQQKKGGGMVIMNHLIKKAYEAGVASNS